MFVTLVSAAAHQAGMCNINRVPMFTSELTTMVVTSCVFFQQWQHAPC